MEQTTYTIGNQIIKAYIPKNPSYQSIQSLYDVCNELFLNEYVECFYTAAQVKKLKANKDNKFLSDCC